MKSLWAVACLVLLAGAFSVFGSGCTGTRSSISEFNRMDVGEGPGATLVQLTELQKKGAGTQSPARPETKSKPAPAKPAPRSVVTPDTTVPATSPGKTGTLAPKPVPNPPPKTAGTSTKVAAASPPPPEPQPPPRQIVPPVVRTPAPATSGKEYSGGPQYRIGPEDILRISVWENKELTLDVVVRPDGMISVPLIQDVRAEGQTASQLSEVIQYKLEDYIKDPNVSVIVLEVNASKFYVVGYVSKPGTYPLRGDVTVLQALSLAGGFTQFASPRKIKLVRNLGQKQEVRVINYYDMIDRGGEGNYLLRPGDTIVVP